jgi:hypothetical protein
MTPCGEDLVVHDQRIDLAVFQHEGQVVIARQGRQGRDPHPADVSGIAGCQNVDPIPRKEGDALAFSQPQFL